MSPTRRGSLVESLEARTLLSALPVDWATLSRGVLHLRGTSGHDQMVVTTEAEGQLHVRRGEQSFDLAVDSVRRIVANLGRGHDLFDSEAAIDTQVNGSTGNDTIATGDGRDRIYGGQGNDTIWTFGGDDRIYGGSGDDIIVAAAGADTVFAGNGKDAVDGNDGNDVLYGEKDGDVVRGGAGRNRLSGGDGNDRVYSDSRHDRIRGDKGTDRFYTQRGSRIDDQSRREKDLQIASSYAVTQRLGSNYVRGRNGEVLELSVAQSNTSPVSMTLNAGVSTYDLALVDVSTYSIGGTNLSLGTTGCVLRVVGGGSVDTVYNVVAAQSDSETIAVGGVSTYTAGTSIQFNAAGATAIIKSGQLILGGNYTAPQIYFGTNPTVPAQFSDSILPSLSLGTRISLSDSQVIDGWLQQALQAYQASGQEIFEYTARWPESGPAGSTTFEMTRDSSRVTLTVVQRGEILVVSEPDPSEQPIEVAVA